MNQKPAKNHVQLVRAMESWQLYLVGIGGIIGSGWLFGSMYAAQMAGPSSILAWVMGAIAIFLIGLVYAELSASMPEAGGVVRFPHYSHGSLASFVVAWANYLTYAATAAIEASAATNYASYYIHSLAGPSGLTPLGTIVGIVLLGVFYVINGFGVSFYGWVNSVLTIAKLVTPILAIVVFLLVDFHSGNFSSSQGGGWFPSGVKGPFTALASAGVIFAFLGFRQVVDLAGEVKNPGRSIPRVLFAVLATVSVLYILLQVAFLGAVPAGMLTHGWARLLLKSPLASLAHVGGLQWLAIIILIDAVISPSGAGLAFAASGPRVAYAMQKNGYFPEWMGRISVRFHVPSLALVTSFIIGVVFLLPIHSWQTLADIIASLTLFTYTIAPVSAVVLREECPTMHRPYQVRSLRVVAPIAFVVGSLIMYFNGWPLTGQVMIPVGVGLLLYVYYASKGEFSVKRDIGSALWLMSWVVFELIISFMGSFGGKHWIHGPWDVLIVVVGSLIAYYWGITSRQSVTKPLKVGTPEPISSEVT